MSGRATAWLRQAQMQSDDHVEKRGQGKGKDLNHACLERGSPIPSLPVHGQDDAERKQQKRNTRLFRQERNADGEHAENVGGIVDRLATASLRVVGGGQRAVQEAERSITKEGAADL